MKRKPPKNKKELTIHLNEEQIKMVCEIRNLSDKYETPYGVNTEGQIGTFPDIMFTILMEQELFELKQRIGIPLFHCHKCNADIKNIEEFIEKIGDSYIGDIIKNANDNIQYYARTGKLKGEDDAVPANIEIK